MNSLYTSGVRQTSSIQADLERMKGGDTSAALLGQISASLAAMQRTVDDYDSMAKREMIKAKQEKALMRVQKFRQDYSELRQTFERLKAEAAQQKAAEERASLLSPNPADAARRRFAGPSTSTPSDTVSESPFRSASATPQSMYSNRERHALDEHSFIRDTDSKLDEFLAQGQAVLDNLVDQRNMLKGTQRRLLDAANTLGLSRDVIGWIERRSTQDMYIFFAGCVVTFGCFFLIWKYLG
ncbi:V-snare-domain-containing protein [Schizophyllum commune H4-8]|uniref:Protein transport protein BOS1 n=1 Tax=Schizophyllum commune (strain H4-8 / FGSC 9210) TaxID=578458 RepID=D8Q8V7_SCHCM|nr:V-snare-domain-containing protein [Schizophyllum commune H4-8]KAI5890656.1 V-snare-domain-containing protein [Schizophyllum commune H4-8]